MELKDFSTVTSQQIYLLAHTLAQRNIPVIEQLEPIADLEELATFATENPTPIIGTNRNPVWRLESVAARLIEAFAIAAHEPIPEEGWEVLARIIVEHTEYLYTYHDSPQERDRLQAGAALALAGGVCYSMPQAPAWRFVGFARITEAIAEITRPTAPFYLIEPIDAAFDLVITLDLPILDEAIKAYNTALNRDFGGEKRIGLQLTDQELFNQLELDFPGLERTKSELGVGNVDGAKSAYEVFLRQRADGSELYHEREKINISFDPQPVPVTFSAAKSCLERTLCLSTQTGRSVSNPGIQSALETSEVGIAALLFPEWRNREQLRKLALRRYKWIIDTHFFPEGFHTDGSTRSHYFVFTHLFRFYRLARLSDLDLPQEFDARLEKMLEVFTYLSQPDYCLPPLGDCNLHEVSASQPCSAGGEVFNRGDFKYIASEGKIGTPPKETSYTFPYAGYYVMRDSWRPDAQYLLFDAGGSGGENVHEDKLNFILYAYGRPLIIDPGLGQASVCRVRTAHQSWGMVRGAHPTISTEDLAAESYFRSSHAHNSLIIDGKRQCRARMDDEEIIPDPDARWLRTPSFDFAEGWYKEGYAAGPEDAISRVFMHKRSIFYVKGEYFVLHDLVLGEGEHQLEQIFHLAPVFSNGDHEAKPGHVETLDGGIVRTAEPDLSNIVIAPTGTADLEVRFQYGKISSHDLVYVTKRSLPAVMNTVLFPLRPGAKMPLDVKSFDVAADADVLATGFSVAHGEFIDLVLVSDDGFARMCTPDIQFCGEYLFLRFDTEGRPQWCGMINGQFLRWEENVLVDLPEPQESYIKCGMKINGG